MAGTEQASSSMSVWERKEHAAPAPKPLLTHERIAEAGVRVADTQGLDALSMRQLADELGVSAMTCYRYVAGKDDVIELMADRVRAGMLLDPLPEGGWRAVLRASALRFREVVRRHPWMPDVPGRILLAPTPAYLAVTEQQFAALAGLGLTVDQMADVAGAVTAYARAGTHDEIARARLGAPEGRADRMAFLLETGDYPTLDRYVRTGWQGSGAGDAQARFEFGLDCLLDGIAARIDPGSLAGGGRP